MENPTVHSNPGPYTVEELAHPDAGADRLFRKLFHAPPPDFPRHFVARCATPSGPKLAGYVHYTVAEPGVFLIGGLAVDASVYREIGAEARAAIASEGSLSRGLLARSIALLGPTRAVFGYTGDIRSRRDVLALGMTLVIPPYLFVQWHDEPEAERPSLVKRIEALGPF